MLKNPKIKAIGIGSYGHDVVDKLAKNNLKYVEFCKLNNYKSDDYTEILDDANIVFLIVDTFDEKSKNIAYNLTKNTKQKGILTLAFLSCKIDQLTQSVDSYTIFDFQSNDLLDNIIPIVKCITYTILEAHMIYVEMDDIKKLIKNSGQMNAFFGCGSSLEMDSGVTILKASLDTKLIKNAKKNLFFVVGSPDIALCQVEKVAEYIKSIASNNAEIVFGASYDKNLNDEMQITILTI